MPWEYNNVKNISTTLAQCMTISLTIPSAIPCLLEKRQKKTVYNEREWAEDLLWDSDKGRICDYCGINIDIPWSDILMFFHEDCWKQYRKDNKPYPLPRYA